MAIPDRTGLDIQRTSAGILGFHADADVQRGKLAPSPIGCRMSYHIERTCFGGFGTCDWGV